MNGYRWIASSSSIASMRRSAMGSSLRMPYFGYVACPKCRLPADQLGGSHDVDHQNDRHT